MSGDRGRRRDAGQPETARPTVELRLLGSFALLVNGQPVRDEAWGASRKARSLVKLLALAPGQQLARDQIIETLWPNLDPAAGVNNFHRTLHAMRRALAPLEVPLRRQMLSLSTSTFNTDVARFEAAASTAWRSPSVTTIQHALDLYRGALLPEDRYEDWTISRRETLHATMLGLLRALATQHEGSGSWTLAIGTLQRLVALDPTDEAAHVALMGALARAGQRRTALQQFVRLRDILRQELAAEPDSAARDLHALILAGRFPPPIAGAVPTEPDTTRPSQVPNNLPIPLTEFVGRHKALIDLRDLLAGDAFPNRLVTLIGAGGCGKSRLALRVASDLAATRAYPDGIWLVELASLRDPAHLPGAIATALSIGDGIEDQLVSAVVKQLRERRTLIVLDNCEHLLAACATMADALLRGCPHLHFLATSRHPLDLAGEQIWRVPGLALPEDRATLAATAANEAVQLFMARARLTQPDLMLTAQNAQAIAQICRHLDGLPLALELAAARTSLLAPDQIAIRLTDRFLLLTGGDRAAPDHQQTLRATIDWSFALLTPAEQQLLARLAVFADGWTLDAAEVICTRQQPAADAVTVFDSLASLVDHSLVTSSSTGPNGQPRFGMLETLHAYATTRLAAAGDADAWHQRHADYFLTLALRAQPLLTGPQQAAWLAQLEREFGNFRAALTWYAAHGDASSGLRLEPVMHSG